MAAQVNLPKGTDYQTAMAVRQTVADSRPSLYVECRVYWDKAGKERFYLVSVAAWMDSKTLQRWANDILGRWGCKGKATIRR